jgi:hypothetical protein
MKFLPTLSIGMVLLAMVNSCEIIVSENQDEGTVFGKDINHGGSRILRTLGWAKASSSAFDDLVDTVNNNNNHNSINNHRQLGYGTAAADTTASSSSSDFTLLELDGQLLGSLLQYRINVNDPRVGKDTITIAYRVPALGWLAIGFADDSSGLMVGSNAVIGLPETEQVWKYSLTGKDVSGIVPFPDDSQTLLDEAVTQDVAAGTTTLIFTKIVAEDGEKQIIPGINTFLGAYGYSNTLGIHSNRQAFEIDLWTGVIEDTEADGGYDDGNQQQQTSPPASTAEDNASVVGQDGFTAVALAGGQLQGTDLLFRINSNDPNAGGADTVTFVYTVPQLGWVGIAFADNGGFMVGSEAVIGLPETGEVLKFDLAGKTTSTVTPMATEKQTLIGASIVQDSSSTTLTFTKRMVEDGEIPIVFGSNTFLAAYSASNALGIHSNRDSFALDLSAPGGVASNLQVRKQALWRAHGLFALIGWGLFLPCAIAASILRGYFTTPLWFQLHRGLNVCVVLFTVIAFTLAIVAINQETPSGASADHFNPDPNPHRTVGLVIFIGAIMQLALGVFRPHVPKEGEAKTTTRIVWEVTHKGLGYSCLAMALYQVPSGIKIYSNIFDEGQYLVAVFWAFIAGIGGAVVLGLITLRLTTGPRRAVVTTADGVKKNIQSHTQPDMTTYSMADQEVPSHV